MWCLVSATGFWLGRVRSLSIIQQKSCRLPVFTSITTCKVHLVKETASFHSGNLFKHYNKRSHFEDLLMIETVALPCTTYIVTGCSTYILICQLSLIIYIIVTHIYIHYIFTQYIHNIIMYIYSGFSSNEMRCAWLTATHLNSVNWITHRIVLHDSSISPNFRNHLHHQPKLHALYTPEV